MNKDIKELITKDFEEAHTEETLAKIIPKFHQSRDVIILSDETGYKGVITEKQLTRTLIDIKNTKAQKVMRQTPKLTTKNTLAEAARLMIEGNIFHLPVFENNKIIGVIKSTQILENTIAQINHLEAKDLMSKKIITIHPTSPLKKALVIFREEGISRIPVKDQEIQGVISLHDVITKALKPTERPGLGHTHNTTNSLDIPVSNLMRKEVIKLGTKATPRQIFDLMKQKDVSSILIEEEGIVTRKDLLAAISFELNKKDEDLFIQISTKIEELNKELVLEEVKSFVEKNKSIGPGHIYIHIHKHKETHRNKPLMHVRLRVRCKDSFDITSEGYGEDHAIREALRKLRVLLLKSDQKTKHEDIMEYFDIEAY